MSVDQPLEVASLCRHCDLSLFSFQTTAELSASTEIIGQQRAVDAVQLGIDMQYPGYNLYVLGEPGSGRHSVVRRLLEAKAREQQVPSDWCYVNNFAEANKPRLLQVPAGRGIQLKQDMQQFVAELGTAITTAFESDEHRARVEAIHKAFKEQEEGALETLGDDSREQGIALLRTPNGFAFAPMKEDAPMAPDEFDKLPDAKKEQFSNKIEALTTRLKQLMQQLPRWRRELQGQLKQANREALGLAAGHLIDELKERYADLQRVLDFLDEVLQDVIEVGEQLREQPRAEGDLSAILSGHGLSLTRYEINLLVDNGAAGSAPVVYEDNPIYVNLAGRVEQVSQFGTLVTNFTLIKPGALHRANGGYLVLDALKVLVQPYTWEALKRALRSREVKIESLGQVFGLVGTLGLEPEPMPLQIKILLVGERRLYYLLKMLDPDFQELFKIAADFENDLQRDADGVRLYAEFIATLARNAGLRPLDRAAVGRVVEHASRLTGDSDKLTTSRRQVSDLMQEADYWAGSHRHATIQREDVEAALAAKIRRADRIRANFQEEILRENVLIDVKDARVGQVNGLAVIALDDFQFAHPVRITATVRLGDGDVIDIERESELGGAIHSKGVMILAAFLGGRFSRNVPFSLSASVVCEQSYGPVEGDSASLAELCALLSNLAALPIQQWLAVTGSVNQFGDVQPIGAVNEKIEGFFDICNARGLTGEQGVIIPAANVKHLMLRHDVVEACAEHRFAVYAVESVDQAIELLTGVPAGEVDEAGNVPEGSVNDRVANQLAELSTLRQSFAGAVRTLGEDGANNTQAAKKPRRKMPKPE